MKNFIAALTIASLIIAISAQSHGAVANNVVPLFPSVQTPTISAPPRQNTLPHKENNRAVSFPLAVSGALVVLAVAVFAFRHISLVRTPALRAKSQDGVQCALKRIKEWRQRITTLQDARNELSRGKLAGVEFSGQTLSNFMLAVRHIDMLRILLSQEEYRLKIVHNSLSPTCDYIRFMDPIRWAPLIRASRLISEAKYNPQKFGDKLYTNGAFVDASHLLWTSISVLRRSTLYNFEELAAIAHDAIEKIRKAKELCNESSAINREIIEKRDFIQAHCNLIAEDLSLLRPNGTDANAFSWPFELRLSDRIAVFKKGVNTDPIKVQAETQWLAQRMDKIVAFTAFVSSLTHLIVCTYNALKAHGYPKKEEALFSILASIFDQDLIVNADRLNTLEMPQDAIRTFAQKTTAILTATSYKNLESDVINLKLLNAQLKEMLDYAEKIAGIQLRIESLRSRVSSLQTLATKYGVKQDARLVFVNDGENSPLMLLDNAEKMTTFAQGALKNNNMELLRPLYLELEQRMTNAEETLEEISNRLPKLQRELKERAACIKNALELRKAVVEIFALLHERKPTNLRKLSTDLPIAHLRMASAWLKKARTHLNDGQISEALLRIYFFDMDLAAFPLEVHNWAERTFTQIDYLEDALHTSSLLPKTQKHVLDMLELARSQLCKLSVSEKQSAES